VNYFARVEGQPGDDAASSDAAASNWLTMSAKTPRATEKVVSFYTIILVKVLQASVSNSASLSSAAQTLPERTLRLIIPHVTRATNQWNTISKDDHFKYNGTNTTTAIRYSPYATPSSVSSGYILSALLPTLSPLSSGVLEILGSGIVRGAKGNDGLWKRAAMGSESSEALMQASDAILAVIGLCVGGNTGSMGGR